MVSVSHPLTIKNILPVHLFKNPYTEDTESLTEARGPFEPPRFARAKSLQNYQTLFVETGLLISNYMLCITDSIHNFFVGLVK